MQTTSSVQRTSAPGWWEQNWKWAAPALAMILVVGMGGMVLALLSVLRSSDAYEGALKRVREAPAVVAALGEPVRDGLLFTGNVTIQGEGGRADLRVDVSGPKGKATVFVVGVRQAGQWTYPQLVVRTQDGNTIDLSEKVRR